MKLYAFVCVLGLVAISSSCNKKNDYTSVVEVIREWNFTISSFNVNAATLSTPTTATFHMVVLGDSSLRYDVKLDSSSETINSLQIKLGDPVTDGALLLNLPIRIYGTYAYGTLPGVSGSVIASLLDDKTEKYINVSSGNAPNGLVRGQLNSEVVLATNVPLSGTSVVPAVNTTTSGTAYIRMTSDKMLYSKIVITADDPTDPVTTATLNKGASGVNGSVIASLVASPTDFGVGKKTTVSAADYATILSNNTYVIVNSGMNAGGKLRGQVK